ncbi:Ubiquitin-conjugating enzyme E2 11 [Borealophlyctis nickersoniae]|nr:Ubiquitin-conjugating enzyme E2 11 [Borealophlyctis nickersoniae]
MATTPRKHSNAAAKSGDPMSVTRRLQSELMDFVTSPPQGISAFPDGDNLLRWAATVKGVPSTAYEDLMFKLTLVFPQNYPYSPPEVKFEGQRCYHPNVSLDDGAICLDILKDKWSAVYNVASILLSVQSLLGEPNPNSPLNVPAADLWNSDKEAYRMAVLRHHKGM